MFWALALAVLIAVGFALAVGWLVGRDRVGRLSTDDDDRAGVKIAAAFGVYGIILGFAVVTAQQSYMDAQYSLRQETGSVLSIVHLGHTLPPEFGAPILADTDQYLRDEIRDWASLSSSDLTSNSSASIQKLYVDVQALSQDPKLTSAQNALFSALQAAESGRADRLLVSRDGTSSLMWVLLAGGGILVLAMSALLHFQSNALRLVLLVGMALLISVSLLTIWAYSNPFSGVIPIGNSALMRVVDSI